MTIHGKAPSHIQRPAAMPVEHKHPTAVRLFLDHGRTCHASRATPSTLNSISWTRGLRAESFPGPTLRHTHTTRHYGQWPIPLQS